MKKVLIFLICILIILFMTTNNSYDVKIPKDAIRYRIVANSNDFKDQEEKNYVNTLIKPILKNIMENNNINEVREKIKYNIPHIRDILDKNNLNYKINFGMNYFPQKTYQNINYASGNYESLVITLGDGLGDNWWCVMFPPLCLVEMNEEKRDNINYSFYIKDIIDKYL